MTRRMDAPADFQCPYRHNCPHMDGISTTWAMEVYQEAAAAAAATFSNSG